ncbi:LAME_0G03004g1_1 [Lachancea meyersii CBS 8951]|uniref:LAME_0G03004g1_1 n=1 Tax=Lachancea meyersii CBS 8951 TaxID=1266667 RepID=A0A1G4K699_9SACH|nr:LAME_0G03004g1_1 [Lachancea meyersii CBS 8951]
MSRFDLDVERTVRKACSYEETAPKRKHVRACIVYTWDHKSSRAIFNAFKVQPLAQDEISLFKALISLHKILQEGHPSAIVEGIRNREWLESLGRIYPGGGGSGYGHLIEEYVNFLLQKLKFHRVHHGFNGTFEYEEYMSLVTTSNPDEGYEAILDLMDLQDTIDKFGRLIFSSISSGRRSECKISALVPLVSETYGIYKFIMSMIRALHNQTGEDDALKPLYDRFCEEHYRLFELYADCSAIKYLTSLIKIPKLPSSAPTLEASEGELNISRPATRGSNNGSFGAESSSRNGSVMSLGVSRQSTQNDGYSGGAAVAPSSSQVTGAYGSFIADNTGVQAQLQAERQKLEELRRQDESIRLQQQQMQEMEAREALAQLEQQRQLALQQQQAQLEMQRQQQLAMQQSEQAMFEQRMREEQQAQYERVAQNEQFQNDLKALREQHERDQVMLQQYDGRVVALEKELENLNINVDDQFKNHEDQIKLLDQWKDKYDGLASLYSQLRQEHLIVLKKLKKSQQVESSAKEAIIKLDALEANRHKERKEIEEVKIERDRVRSEVEKLKAEIGKIKIDVVRDVLGAAGKSIMESVPVSECATNLANEFNELILDGGQADLQPITSSIMSFCKEVSGREEGQEYVYTLKHMRGTPEEITDKVIDLNIALQTKLSPIQTLVNLPQNDAVKAITNLIRASTACQAEIATTQNPDPYLQQNRWSRGLVSAAEEVAKATRQMVSANSYEIFTAASNQVLASTAQLVAACRVKNPPSQPRLEQYSRIVNAAVKAMRQEPPEITLPNSELDLQAHIVQLENALEQSRKKLGEMRY